MTFDELNLDARVLEAVKGAGYTEPTPIQAQGIPPALEGRDVLGIAQTGTGKTASFSLPMISRLAKGRARARMPRSLVLCPTRELAAQVAENFETYSKGLKLSMALLIGGVSFNEQDKKIDRGVDVLIATPGRLLDHFERGKLMLSNIEIMVVDEADRMLDMGFIPDIEKIFGLTPFTRQTLFFSATMPPEIQRITDTFLQNPVKVEVARESTVASTVTQALRLITAERKDKLPNAKREALRDMIREEGDSLKNAIIFCNRKRDVTIVHKSLEKHGFDVASLHGDLDQRIRMQVLSAFRDGKIRLLVASDVAARGLDIPDVSHVYNFDIPTHAEDYVHRIGRTGRAGRSGKAFSLTTKGEEKYLKGIEDMLGIPIPLMEVAEAPKVEAAAEVEEEKPQRKARSIRGRGRKKDEDQTAKEVAPEAVVETKPAEQPKQAREEAQGGRQKNDRRPARGERKPRNNDRNEHGDRAVRGLGDHMPAFMLIPLPDLSRKKSSGDDDDNVADAA